MHPIRLQALALATAAAGLAAACGTTVPNARSVDAGQGLGPATAPLSSSGTADVPATGPGGTRGPGTTTVSGGSSASSGSATGPSAGGGTAAGAVGGAPTSGGIPASGPGWDAKSVNLGIIVATDASNTLHTLGISIDPGDELGDARAVVAHLNRQGGLFGRKVNLLVKDDQASHVLANPAGAGEEDCTFFTQDHHAIAVVNTDASLDLDAFRACFAKARTPLVSETTSAFDDVVTSKLAPYFYNALSVPTNLVVQPLFDHLRTQRYFTGWNAQTGAASPAGKVKVGVIYSSTGSGPRAAKAFLSLLQRAGYPTDSFEMNSASDANAAVLHFAGNGVTHLVDPAGCCFLLYLPQANSQHYYPRLGITTAMGPQVVQGIASSTQLRGALGVGWFPTLDVDAPKDPGPNPGTRECLAALKAGGQTFSGKRFAEAFGMALCDGLRLAYLAAKAGGGLSPEAIRTGVLKLGTSFPTGGPFSSGLSQTDFGVPGSGRELGYDSACPCFTYRGGSFRF